MAATMYSLKLSACSIPMLVHSASVRSFSSILLQNVCAVHRLTCSHPASCLTCVEALGKLRPWSACWFRQVVCLCQHQASSHYCFSATALAVWLVHHLLRENLLRRSRLCRWIPSQCFASIACSSPSATKRTNSAFSTTSSFTGSRSSRAASREWRRAVKHLISLMARIGCHGPDAYFF